MGNPMGVSRGRLLCIRIGTRMATFSPGSTEHFTNVKLPPRTHEEVLLTGWGNSKIRRVATKSGVVCRSPDLHPGLPS